MKTHEVTITNHYQDTITSPNDNMDTARHLFTDLSGYHSREKIISMILDAIRDMKKDAERLRNDWDTRLAAACMDPNSNDTLTNYVDGNSSEKMDTVFGPWLNQNSFLLMETEAHFKHGEIPYMSADHYMIAEMAFIMGDNDMANVIRDTRTISSLITLEDIIEEIVGEIADEHEPRRIRPSSPTPRAITLSRAA